MLSKLTEQTEVVSSTLKTYSSLVWCKVCIIGSSLLLLRYVYLRILRNVYKIPPGPVGLPYFGSLISLGMNERKFFATMSSYGSITSFYLNDLSVILVNDPKISIELLKNEHLLSRPYVNPEWMGNFGTTYESMSTMPYGNQWKWHRKLFHKCLLKLNGETMNKTITLCFENTIKLLIDKCIKNNRLWYPEKSLFWLAFNNVFYVTFGRTLDINDTSYVKYNNIMQARINKSSKVLFLGMLGFKNKWLSNYLFNYMEKELTTQWNSFTKWILETTGYHYKLNYNGKIEFKFKGKKCILHKTEDDIIIKLLLNEYTNKSSKLLFSNNEYNKYKKKNLFLHHLFHGLDDMFMGGIDTTANTLEYILILCGKHTSIQNNMYNELINVLKDRNLDKFDLSIINNCNIFKAFVHEGIRLSTVVRLGVPRLCNKNINILNYKIAKNSVVFFNLHKCNRNKSAFKSGNNFDINNFLNPKTNKFKYNSNLLTFSIGNRNCPGINVAFKLIYIIFANILLNYKIELFDKNTIIKQDCQVVQSVYPKIGLKMSKRN